jgi:hypothetical protein
VTKVRKTSELTSLFNIIGGFKLLNQNDSEKKYVSIGGILSLGDYDDNAGI